MSEPLHVVCPSCDATNRVPEEKLAEGGNCGRCKQPLFTGKPMTLTHANLEKQLANSDIPVVIDFWASWCGPCMSFAPVFERSAALLEPQVRLAKLDTQSEPAAAAQFGIRSIPTLVVVRRGEEIARISGAMNQQTFVDWVRSVI